MWSQSHKIVNAPPRDTRAPGEDSLLCKILNSRCNCTCFCQLSNPAWVLNWAGRFFHPVVVAWGVMENTTSLLQSPNTVTSVHCWQHVAMARVQTSWLKMGDFTPPTPTSSLQSVVVRRFCFQCGRLDSSAMLTLSSVELWIWGEGKSWAPRPVLPVFSASGAATANTHNATRKTVLAMTTDQK